ncbi:two-component system phosphate regulon sensor histidine kinase PhoR [Hephaestia caeni]|uniref:histidine kinase n=1 Tax=Hephaestia caeni TaxID=645617 RepID=A0A397PB94_9SPHN|nr:ATP-binding protein [Hephaestia caeni]RIA46846.1 two-component system phosphate regulon sensor histidine kinase PhoR [Hephaestia caeni]
MAQKKTFAAIGLVLAGAAAALIFAHSPQSALFMLVAGVAAVLVLRHPEAPPPATIDGDGDARDAVNDLIEALGDPILVLAGNHVVRANTAARALLGAHVLGQDVRLAVRHPDAARRLGEADDTGGGEPVTLIGLGRRDSHWQMQVAAMGSDRRLVHLVDRSRSAAAEKMRVDFVANASHELRTPLASLLGFIETLEDDAGADPALRARFLGVMAGEARRMQRLVVDLLSLSRIESDKDRLPTATIDLAAITRTVVDELRRSDPDRGADLEIDCAHAIPPITGDRAQMSQLLHNLVGNAMKYGRAGTPVTVRLEPGDAGDVTLTVADRGDGIPPEHLPRLTERFYRVDSGRSRALGGTGLGLAIVKHIAERHRGRLVITSAPGEGTTVTVHFPAVQADPPTLS